MYALGVVAYELLAGRLPFQGVDLRQQHLEETPETISGIPDRLRSLVNECLYKGPEARPRPQNLLARLQGSMQAASAAASRLQQANALAVQRKAEDERQQSAAQVEAERRRTLRAAAEQSLETALALLHQQIADNAPAVRAAGSPPRSWALNDATLRVGTITVAVPKPDERMQLPFDVVAHTSISLSVPRDRYGYTGHSHSLWYCDAQDEGEFRWYETAFMITFGGSERRGFAPFDMHPGDPAAMLALSSVTHTHQVAWPFTPIDQGDEDAFIERWMGWIGEAPQGQIRRPSTLPEVNPPRFVATMMLQERMTIYCKDPKAKRETIPGASLCPHRPDQRGIVAIAAANHGDGTARSECSGTMAWPDAGSTRTPVAC